MQQSEVPTIVNAYLSGGKVCLLRREPDGELKSWKIPAEYSLFVKKTDYEKIKSLKGKRGMKDDGDYIRIICSDYDERDRLCRGFKTGNKRSPGFFEQAGIETFEADLNPIKRFLIDSGAKIQKPISGYLDIETDSRVPFVRKEEARILCWGFVIKRGDVIERFGGVLEEDTDEAERELLKDLFYEACNVDQILAWNGDRFDFEVLKARIEYLGLQINLRRWLLCDHMILFSKYNMTASESGDEKTSKALNRVALSLGISGKLTDKGVGELAGRQVGGALAWEFWKSGGRNRELLLEYCVEDASIMERIEEKSGVVDILSAVAEACGTFPDSRGMMGMNFVESFLMRLCVERGMRAPTKYGYNEENKEQFKGAYVFPTKRGLFKDVHICDFAGMYPSIMRAWNMSPDTYVGRSSESNLEDAIRKSPSNVAVCPNTLEMFRLDGRRGLFSEALDKIVGMRKYWKDKKNSYPPRTPDWYKCYRRDQAFKIIANTFYGVSGSPMSRFFMREVSESVTQIGVWLIRTTADNSVAKNKTTIIGGDTDSLFIQGCSKETFEEFVNWCNKELYPSIIKPTRGEPKFIEVNFEKTLGLMINVEKKTYAGRASFLDGKPVPDDVAPVIKGLEFKRGDSAKLAREMQEQIVKTILLHGKPIPEEYPLDVKDLVPIAEKWQKHILDALFEYKDAIIAKQIKKSIKEYGQTLPDGRPGNIPPHVQIAKIMEEKGEAIYPGVKIEYIVTDGHTSPQKIKPAADGTKEDLDLFHLWESVVWPASLRVLDAAFPGYNWDKFSSVRPMKGVLPGQTGFDFGQRKAPPIKKN